MFSWDTSILSRNEKKIEGWKIGKDYKEYKERKKRILETLPHYRGIKKIEWRIGEDYEK